MWREREKVNTVLKGTEVKETARRQKMWPLRSSNENKFTGQSPNNSFLFSSQVCHQTVTTRAAKMVRWTETLNAQGNLSLIPSARIKMEEKNRLKSCPLISTRTYTPTYKNKTK